MTTTVATLKAVFTADTADFDKGKRKVEGGLSSIGSSISGLGDSMSGIGRSMIGFAAPVTAALGGAVYAAMDFDEQLRNIQAVTGDSTANIDALGLSIIDMNTRFSSTELAATFYDVAGGVTDATQRMDVFNTAIHVAQAGNAGLQGTTQALIATMNAYAGANLSAADAGDILVRTVGMGVGTMDNFAAALPNVIGIASSVGISFEEIAAATAYLTTKGNSASEATTQLSAAISALLTPNAAMTEAFRMAGIESGSLALENQGLMGTLDLLKESFGGNVDEMAKAFGSVEALRAVVSLVCGDVDEFFTTFSEGVEGATASAEQIQMQSAAAQFDLLKSSLQDVAIQIGLALLPAINRIGKAVLPIVTKFAAWAKENPKLITTIAAIAIGITGLGIAFSVIGGILGVIGTAFTVFGAILGVVLSPIGLVVLGIGALAAAIYFLSGGTLQGLIDGFKEAVKWIGEFASGLFNAFQEGGLEGAGQFIMDKIITPLLNAVVNADWSQIGSNIWRGIQNAFNAAAGFLWDAALWVTSNITFPLIVAASNVNWGWVATAIWNGFKASLDTGANIYFDGSQFIANAIVFPLVVAALNADWGKIATEVWNGLTNAMQTINATTWNAAQWFSVTIASAILNAALGTDWAMVATQVWNGIKSALDGIDAATWAVGEWIANKLIAPLVLEVAGIDWNAVIVSVGDFGASVFSKLADTIPDIANWVLTNLINPLVAEVASVGTSFKTAINDAIPNDIGFSVGPIDLPSPIPDIPATRISAPIPDPFAKGGDFSAGQFMLVGEQGPELIVPRSSGTVIPNNALAPSGNGGWGGQGVVINGGTFIVQGVQDVEDLYNKLAQLNRNRTKPAFKAG